MIREVVLVFYGIVSAFILGIFSIAIVDGVFQKIMDYADIQPTSPFYPCIPLLDIFCVLCLFIPLWTSAIVLFYFYIRNIWQEARTWIYQ